MLKRCLVLLLSLFLNHGYSQEGNSGVEKSDSTKKNYQIEDGKKLQKWIGGNYRWGYVLQTNDYVNGDNPGNTKITGFQALDLKFGWQTTGTKDWHTIYNFPYYGIGLYNANFFYSDDLGTPTALHFFWGGNIKRWGRHAINYKWGLGLSWNWKPYDPVDNPRNVAIGSYRNFYLDFGFEYVYQLSDEFDLAGGLYFSHFSNGAIRTPNLGIGLIAPAVELRYHIDSRPVIIPGIKPKYEQEDELYLLLAFGAKQLAFDTANYESPYFDETYSVISVSAAWLHGFDHYIKAGIGADFSYDNSLDASFLSEGIIDEDDILQESDKSALGLFGTVEFIFHRISIISSLGAYLYNKEVPEIKPRLYQRLGIKYHFTNSLFAGINVRAYEFSKADYVEWNVGYRLKWNRDKEN
jgi:hypothetical protein